MASRDDAERDPQGGGAREAPLRSRGRRWRLSPCGRLCHHEPDYALYELPLLRSFLTYVLRRPVTVAGVDAPGGPFPRPRRVARHRRVFELQQLLLFVRALDHDRGAVQRPVRLRRKSLLLSRQRARVRRPVHGGLHGERDLGQLQEHRPEHGVPRRRDLRSPVRQRGDLPERRSVQHRAPDLRAILRRQRHDRHDEPGLSRQVARRSITSPSVSTRTGTALRRRTRRRRRCPVCPSASTCWFVTASRRRTAPSDWSQPVEVLVK